MGKQLLLGLFANETQCEFNDNSGDLRTAFRLLSELELRGGFSIFKSLA